MAVAYVLELFVSVRKSRPSGVGPPHVVKQLCSRPVIGQSERSTVMGAVHALAPYLFEEAAMGSPSLFPCSMESAHDWIMTGRPFVWQEASCLVDASGVASRYFECGV